MNTPAILSNSDMIEALDIARQLIDIEKSVDKSVMKRPFDSHKASIDELAKRARECVAKMDKWRYK